MSRKCVRQYIAERLKRNLIEWGTIFIFSGTLVGLSVALIYAFKILVDIAPFFSVILLGEIAWVWLCVFVTESKREIYKLYKDARERCQYE
jgi:hypothetical protein